MTRLLSSSRIVVLAGGVAAAAAGVRAEGVVSLAAGGDAAQQRAQPAKSSVAIQAAKKPSGAPSPQPPTPGAPGAAGTAAAANPCDYLDPAEAAPLVGADATLTTAPSRGAFVSCGYTSPAGDAVTIYVSDYGLAQVAQQFFERNRDSLKTAVPDETLGVPAFTHRTAEQPFKVTVGAVKGTRTVLLEAVGPTATDPQGAPRLHAIVEKALAKLPAEEPPPPPQ